MLWWIVACASAPNPAIEPTEPPTDAGPGSAGKRAKEDRVGQFEDLSGLSGRWPVRSGTSACEGDRGFELVPSQETRTGWRLVDRTTDPAVTYDVTGARRDDQDGVLRLALRATPEEVRRMSILVAESGEWATVTWTTPATDPFELVTPHGAGLVPTVPCR